MANVKSEDYRVKKGFISRLPTGLKAEFIKFWFAGAVFYFIGWGTFIQSLDQLDLIIALGFVLGLVTELMVNRILVYLESSKKEYRPYMLCAPGRFVSLPVNLVICGVISFLVSYTYHFLNVFAISISGAAPGTVFIGAEPILYGVFFIMYDGLFLLIKKAFTKIIPKRDDIQEERTV